MIEELKNYVIENNLINKAKECFWRAFNNWKQENPERYAEKFQDIDEKNLELYVQCVGLRAAAWPECDYNHVTVSMRILHNSKKCEELGTYIIWFSLNGNEEDDDDFLEI